MSKPKYLLIKSEIKNNIMEGIYSIGSKIPSESAFQKTYDVSRHTIRLAFSELVNEGYLLKKQGSGTYVHDGYLNEHIKSNKTIGVITTYVSDYIFPSIIRGIEDELSQEQYSLMLSSTHNNVNKEKISLESMLNQHVDGIIIEPTKSSLLNPNLNYYVKIIQKKIPLLMLHAKYDELDVPAITMDDFKAGKIATDHLINLGHEKIALITKSDDHQGKKRLKGYVNALNENELSFESEHVISYETETMDELPNRVQKVINGPSSPTAFVCYNDQIAVLLIKKLLAMGKKVPDDFSVVSIDNSYLSTTLPSLQLTSVNHPKEEMGKVAAKWMLEAIENKSFDKSPIVFEPELVIGNSTKKINDE